MSAPETAAPLTLLAMLVIASQSDLRQHRIPNVVSLAGLIAGLALHALADGLHGMLSGLAGAAVGLLCFAPFYLLRGMGGGDVKLLAAAGGFLGPQGALLAALFSLLAGGFTAIAYVMWQALRASADALMRNDAAAMCASAWAASHIARRDRLAFALPITLGSIAACWQQNGFAAVASWSLGWLS